jgi:hypothetical protein
MSEPINELLARVRDYDQHTSDDDIDRLCDEIERLTEERDQYKQAWDTAIAVGGAWKRERDDCRRLLREVFEEPGPVSENAGASTEFAYFWRKNWLQLKAKYEAVKAGGDDE